MGLSEVYQNIKDQGKYVYALLLFMIFGGMVLLIEL